MADWSDMRFDCSPRRLSTPVRRASTEFKSFRMAANSVVTRWASASNDQEGWSQCLLTQPDDAENGSVLSATDISVKNMQILEVLTPKPGSAHIVLERISTTQGFVTSTETRNKVMFGYQFVDTGQTNIFENGDITLLGLLFIRLKI